MLKLTIEESLTGPLAHPPTRKALEELVDRSKTLDEVAAGIRTITGLMYYRGGSHIAIHCKHEYFFSDLKVVECGHTRWAIITEGEG